MKTMLSYSITEGLPVVVREVEWAYPTLVLRGDGWSSSATCPWRVVTDKELSFSWSTGDVSDRVWDLIGHEISGIRTDPITGDVSLDLSGDPHLEVFADTTVEPWVLRLAGKVLIGPLRDD